MSHANHDGGICFDCLRKAEQRFSDNGHLPGDNDDYLRSLYRETREGFHSS